MIYSYRKAEESDKEAIYQLCCLVMHGLISKIWDWDEQWQCHDFSAHFEPLGTTVVFHADELVGYSQVETHADQLFIRMIVLHPLHQRLGIGRKLLDSIVELSAGSCKPVRLEVFKINIEAKKFYERYGFKIEGETPYSYIMSYV